MCSCDGGQISLLQGFSAPPGSPERFYESRVRKGLVSSANVRWCEDQGFPAPGPDLYWYFSRLGVSHPVQIDLVLFERYPAQVTS